jgi:hypothetical protein
MTVGKILVSAGDITHIQPLSKVPMLHILCSSPNSNCVMKSRWMRHAGSLCNMEEVRNTYKF